MKKGIIFSDVHRIHSQPEHWSYMLLKQFAESWQPDFAINLGDWLDLPYLSTYDKYNVFVQAEANMAADWYVARRDIAWWLDHTDQYVWLEGNHEERLQRTIARDPAYRDMMDPEMQLYGPDEGDERFEYIPLTDQPYKVGKLNCIHGWWVTKYHTAKALDMISGNVVMGHVHRFQTVTKTQMDIGRTIAAWSLGCLSEVQPDYMKGRPSGHQLGFATIYLAENGEFNLYPIVMNGNGLMYEGREYRVKI